jgi:hypothetical protein
MLNPVRFGNNYAFKPAKGNEGIFSSEAKAAQFVREVLTNDSFNQYGGVTVAADAKTGEVFASTETQSSGFQPRDARAIAIVIGNLVEALKKKDEGVSANGHKKAETADKSSSPAYLQLADNLLREFKARKGFDATFEY